QTLVPSLLAVRRTNETLSNHHANLFEIAKIYLPRPSELPEEPWMLTLVTEGGFATAKGVVEALIAQVSPSGILDARVAENTFFTPGRGAELLLNGERFGILGEVAPETLRRFEL